MNKQELIDAVAKTAGLTKTDTAKALDAFFETVSKTLKKGDDVRITNFGTFAVVKRAATTAKKPGTNEIIKVKACKRPKFRAGKGLKDAVN